jgi:N6-L-threonylcarbamoyladenine synthase
VQVLVSKALAALAQERLRALAVVGGVSANSRLRGLLNEWAEREGFRLAVPPMAYCTDNAAMIASAGRHVLMSDPGSIREFDIQPALQVEPLSGHTRREEITHS